MAESVPLESWKPDHPEGTLYAYDQQRNQIIAKLPDGTLLHYDLDDPHKGDSAQ